MQLSSIDAKTGNNVLFLPRVGIGSESWTGPNRTVSRDMVANGTALFSRLQEKADELLDKNLLLLELTQR